MTITVLEKKPATPREIPPTPTKSSALVDPAMRALAVFALPLVGIVIACYTLLKSRVEIPGLWSATVHRRRELRLVPMQEFFDPTVWWAPVLNAVGNTAMFLPVGFLLIVIAAPRTPIRRAAVVGLSISLSIEVTQFVFALGYSDIDDLIFNTLGAIIGAYLASHLRRQGRLTFLGLIIAGSFLATMPFAVEILA